MGRNVNMKPRIRPTDLILLVVVSFSLLSAESIDYPISEDDDIDEVSNL